jgi:hypothetical protein
MHAMSSRLFLPPRMLLEHSCMHVLAIYLHAMSSRLFLPPRMLLEHSCMHVGEESLSCVGYLSVLTHTLVRLQRVGPKRKTSSQQRREERRKRGRMDIISERLQERRDARTAEELFKCTFSHRNTTTVGALPITDTCVSYNGSDTTVEELIVQVRPRSCVYYTVLRMHVCVRER